MAEEEKTVSCDILQEKYAEVRAVGEAYKKALYAFGKVTAPEVQEKKEEFESRLQKLREMLWEYYGKYKELVESDDTNIRKDAAKDQNLPPNIIEKFINDKDKNVRLHAAANQNLPDDALKACAESDDGWLRFGAARNSNLTSTLAEQLFEDKDDEVRRAVAENPNLSDDALRICVESNDSNLCLGAAKNSNLTPELASQIVNNKSHGYFNSDIHQTVAANQNLPDNVIRTYANSDNKKPSHWCR